MTAPTARSGASLVEVVVAMLVLTIGVLAMAAASGYMTIQIRIAKLRTERAAAIQGIIEQVRATPFSEIESLPEAQATEAGSYRVWWDVDEQGTNLLRITVHSKGPGYVSGTGWVGSVHETTIMSLARLRSES